MGPGRLGTDLSPGPAPPPPDRVLSLANSDFLQLQGNGHLMPTFVTFLDTLWGCSYPETWLFLWGRIPFFIPSSTWAAACSPSSCGEG